MARRGRGGLIHYTFGHAAEGGGHPLNGRSLLLGGLVREVGTERGEARAVLLLPAHHGTVELPGRIAL